jgi:photosystem II stability/assembly factor-like uncharacterized protein
MNHRSIRFSQNPCGIILGILLLATSAFAQTDHWRPIGPWGGGISWFGRIGNVLYAASTNLYTSLDNGATWSIVKQERVGPLAGGFIAHGSTVISLRHPWMRSTDRGMTWTRIDSQFVFAGLAFNGDTLFGACARKGLVRSLDGGATWEATGILPSSRITAMKIFANAIYIGSEHGLYRSADHGESWKKIALDARDTCIVKIFPLDHTILVTAATQVFANANRVYRSIDSGAIWTRSTFAPKTDRINTVARAGARLFAGGSGRSGALFSSTNEGASWNLVKEPFTIEVSSLDIIGDTILAGNSPHGDYCQVYRSIDRGESWTIADIGISTFPITMLSVRGETLIATGNYNQWYGPDRCGMFTTTNGGLSWNIGSLGDESGPVRDIATTGTHFLAGRGAVYASTDVGVTWRRVGLHNEDVAQFAVHGQTVIARTAQGQLARSTNGGEWWNPIPSPSASSGEFPHAIIYKDSTLLAITRATLFRSHDHGTTWKFAGFSLAHVVITGIVASKEAILISTNRANGKPTLLRSSDGGANWYPADEAFDGETVLALATKGDLVIAATQRAIYRSRDNGEHWEYGAAVPIGRPVSALAIIGETLYAGTHGSGIYHARLSVADDAQLEAATIYPNPTLDYAALRYTLRDEARVKIDLFDALGQLVTSLADRSEKAGEHIVSIDLTGHPAGSYLCRLTIGERSAMLPVQRL